MNSKQKTVAILGNGVVGVAVAKGFAEQGYRVIFGTRDIAGAKTKEALAAVPGATAAGFAEAAKAGDLAFIALPWDGLRAGLEMAGAHNLTGKLVIDA
ncbi:MAG TPA: NAD(P)-binding domain-containing protein, partial [Noviherbaspirillum sp.]